MCTGCCVCAPQGSVQGGVQGGAQVPPGVPHSTAPPAGVGGIRRYIHSLPHLFYIFIKNTLITYLTDICLPTPTRRQILSCHRDLERFLRSVYYHNLCSLFDSILITWDIYYAFYVWFSNVYNIKVAQSVSFYLWFPCTRTSLSCVPGDKCRKSDTCKVCNLCFMCY